MAGLDQTEADQQSGSRSAAANKGKGDNPRQEQSDEHDGNVNSTGQIQFACFVYACAQDKMQMLCLGQQKVA